MLHVFVHYMACYFSNKQYGVIKGSSTVLQLLTSSSAIAERLQEAGYVLINVQRDSQNHAQNFIFGTPYWASWAV